MKARISITTTDTTTVDIGDFPPRMVEEMIRSSKNASSIYGEWGLWDLTDNINTTLDAVEVDALE